MRTNCNDAQFAVCGNSPTYGGGILFWHTDYHGAEQDARLVKADGGFVYVVASPGGEIDPWDENMRRHEALAAWDAIHDPLRVKPFAALNAYKVRTKADIIDLARLTLNEYSLSDRDYNRIITAFAGGSRDYYTSDLTSMCHSAAQATPYQRERRWADYLDKRSERWRRRAEFRAILSLLGLT